MRFLSAFLYLSAAFLATPLLAQGIAPPECPQTRAEPLTERIFGEEISDPYRWLEADIRQSAEVADWVHRQNAATEDYLAQIPARDWFREKLSQLQDFERFGIPRKAGERYFYTRNSGLLNQPQLFVQEGLTGERRLLLDPNRWSGQGDVALASWEPSPDGSMVALSIQSAGSDWRRVRILDVATGKMLASDLRWIKFSRLAWVGTRGLLYSRFPEPREGEDFTALNFNHAVYFHRIGDPQSSDLRIYDTPRAPGRRHQAEVTGDGRWAIITSSEGTDARNSVRLVDLQQVKRRGWRIAGLIPGIAHEWDLLASVDGWLYFRTDFDAPRGRILAVDPGKRKPRWYEVLAERKATLENASIVGRQIVVETLVHDARRAELFDLSGRPLSAISLARLGTASGFGGKPGDTETFYAFTSFNRPHSVYRLDLTTGETEPFAEPALTFVPHRYIVEQKHFTSKDGTRVPMFIVRSRELAESGKPAPTLLYGYGGFDVSLTPGFSAKRMAWLEAGGVFALANVRGGGELGREWHEAGRKRNKQNSFDDFIAAGEFLKREGYTTADGLAIEGRSNGGLLVAAVVNQRPDLFDAAHAAVGVMDMVRFDRWTAGRYWLDDYGSPSRKRDFRTLRAYSPYHNIAMGAQYPAMLLTTADTDDRVVPAHSFKHIAALQAADVGTAPRLIRVTSGAGHGRGKSMEKRLLEDGDVLTFLSYHTGLSSEIPDIQKSRHFSEYGL